MFEESPQSKVIFDYLKSKYGEKLAFVGLAKVLASISPMVNPKKPNLSIFNVMPTRQFKSRTSIETINMIKKVHYVQISDDITMNAILNKYKDKLNNKAMFVNDGTVLFATKSQQVKNRLIAGLSVLLSEGEWGYGDRQAPESILKGNVSIIMNMTFESYNMYESKLLGSTFLERFITLFCSLSKEELTLFAKEKQKRMSIHWKGKISFKKTKLLNLSEHEEEIIKIAQKYSALSLKSFNGCHDQIFALIVSHCSLNKRDNVTKDEFELLKALEKYVVNPFAPNEHRIIELHNQNKTYKEICIILGRNYDKYKPYISRVIRKAKERGIIENEVE